jgi:hypothetical protein
MPSTLAVYRRFTRTLALFRSVKASRAVRTSAPTSAKAQPGPGAGSSEPAIAARAISGYELSAMPADASFRQEF